MNYCTAERVRLIFGSQNVDRWADLDNSGIRNDIDARIANAISVASAEVDSVLSGSPMAQPLSVGGEVPLLIQEVCATLAGLHLYEARGVQGITTQDGQPVHPYIFKRVWAMKVLDELRSGRRRIYGGA